MPLIVFDTHDHGFPQRAEKLIRAAMEMLFHPLVSIPNGYDHLKDKVDQTTDGPKGLQAAREAAARQFEIQIRQAILLPVARKVEQMMGLNQLTMEAVKAASRTDFPLSAMATFHPNYILENKDWQEMICLLMAMGFIGIKLHSLTQQFDPQGEAAQLLYGFCQDKGLPLLFDTYHHPLEAPLPESLARGRYYYTDVDTLLWIRANFPTLKIIAAHMGSMGRPEEAKRLLGLDGLPIMRDTSFELNRYPDEEARRILLAEPANYMFGSDYPAQLIVDSIMRILRLKLPLKIQEQILFRNAEDYFGIRVS